MNRTISRPWRERWQRTGLKVAAWVAFVLAAFMFWGLLRIQRATFETRAQQEELRGRARELKGWLLDFAECPGANVPFEQCQKLERAHADREVMLPSAELPALVASLNPVPNRVLANHVLTEPERAWLQTHPLAVLVMPRASLNSVVLHTARRSEVAFGHGSGIALPVYTANLEASPVLTLEFDMAGLPTFGPLDLPILLAEPDDVASYESIPVREFAANALTRQLQIGIPVIFAALAIILDHSVVFSLLAFQAVAMSARAFLSHRLETVSGAFWSQQGLYVVNGLTFAFLILLVADLSGVVFRRRFVRPALLAGAPALFLLGQFADPIYTLRVDAWSDSAACLVGLVLVALGGFLWLRDSRKPGDGASEEGAFFALSRIVLLTRYAILALGLAIHLQVNVRDLLHVDDADFLRGYNDWQHSALVLALVAASLLEVGSTARRVQRAARELAHKAIMEQELQVGRDFQKHMLPGRKGRATGLFWRALYCPASALAGDWFDIRELTFTDGVTVTVVVVADVTGHGVGASLSTSVLSCLWGLWCAEAIGKPGPTNREECEKLLQSIPYTLNSGLLAMRRNEGATAIFAVIPASGDFFSVCSAGHPGAMLASPEGLTYMATPGKKLGSGSATQSDWACKGVAWPAEASLVLTTDGLIPAGKSASSFAKQIDRDVKAGKGKADEILVRSLVGVRRLFRMEQDVRDDVTLVFFRRAGGAHPEA